jgi:hypothetical protein
MVPQKPSLIQPRKSYKMVEPVKAKPLIREVEKSKKFPDLTGDGQVTKADILEGRGVNEKGALRAAKQGAKAKVKSEFKAKVAEAKFDMPKKEAKSAIGEERKKYISAKKEIGKYTDY